MTHDHSHPVDGETHQPAVISPALRKRLQQCFDHGSKLAAQDSYDFDYAHTLFAECVAKDPGNLVFIDAFLTNLHRKYNNNKRGSRLAMFSSKGGFKKAVAKKAWGEVLELGPDVLKTNPWDIPTLRSMAEACAAFGYVDAELRWLRNALDANPRDAEVNRHCAMSLTRIGNFDQAIACWHRVEEAKPDDPEPPKMISELHTAKTRPRAVGEPPKGKGAVHSHRPTTSSSPTTSPVHSTPSTTHAKSESVGESANGEPYRRREIPLTQRQKLEQTLVNHPTDVETYLDLAQLHVDEDRIADALRVLSKGLTATGNDLSLQNKLDDVQILRAKNQLAIAEKRAHDGGEEAKALAHQLRDELNRVELDVFTRRSQRLPNDLHVRYELAVRLKRVDNLAEAMNQFTTLKDEAAYEVHVALEMGEILQKSRQYAKALQQYQRAVEMVDHRSHPGHDLVELKKLGLYRTAVLATGVKDIALAERNFEVLLEVDADYKDARERLDKLREIGHKS